jgi:hypothetical protein
MKLVSDGGDCGSRKLKLSYGNACDGIWRSLHLAGDWSQAVGFVLMRLAGIWFQSPFIFNLLYKGTAYRNC